jgi:hypothetical protein
MMLQAALGLSIDGGTAQVRFGSPALPAFLDVIQIRNLNVGHAALDLVVDRSFRGIGVERRSGSAEIVIY